MTRTKLDASNELNLITAIIINDDAAKAFSDINSKLFPSSYVRLVYGWARDYYKEYQKACRRDITEIYKNKHAVFNDSDEDDDNIKLFLERLNDRYEECNNFDFTIDQGHEYLKKRTEAIFAEKLKEASDNGEDAAPIIAAYKPYTSPSTLPTIYSGSELITKEFEPPAFIVLDFIASGVGMLVGAMKSGKSWLVLQLAANIASGQLTLGKFKTNKCGVLYLALEDGPARLADRLKMLHLDHLRNLNIATEWRRGVDGLADIRTYIEANPNVKIIFIDTLGCFRNAPKSRNIFQSEYDSIREFKKLADEKKVCIMLIHHTRKPGINQNENVDVLDSINGSSGLGAACDSIMVLRRKRGGQEATLYCTSRDIEEKDWGLHWNISDGGWKITGTAEEQALHGEHRDIINFIEDNDGKASLGNIAKAIHKDTINTNQILKRMIRDGYVKKVKYGEYSIV